MRFCAKRDFFREGSVGVEGGTRKGWVGKNFFFGEGWFFCEKKKLPKPEKDRERGR